MTFRTVSAIPGGVSRRALLGLAAAAALAAASPGGAGQALAAQKTLKVGVSAGPYGDILAEAAKIVAKDGLKVEVVEFSDWNLPNAAVESGDIDFNAFQHTPYLDNQVKARGYHIVPLETAIVVPAGLYSSKHRSKDAIPDGAVIAIPNDPSNAARALFLAQQAGLIRLRPGADVDATLADIAENPKKLKFRELDAAQLARSLDDVDVAWVSSNYAHLAGLKLQDALEAEKQDSKWALVFAARADRKDDPDIRRFIAAYRSEPVRAFILERFKGSILPAF
ncbi:MetQ/NlpA family ABC transporter substrate-binding protein [Camelimonas abortus]|uniref:Lipoprotein n=1 Tax=Camelimonas abortus TaxID=1017184 RepID=A0ABV7LB71_9HYPH